MSFYKKISDAIAAALSGKDAVVLAKVARDAVMSAAKRLCEHKGVGVDDDVTLIELIHSPVIEEFVGTIEAVAALDFVRILGTNADHERGVKKTRAAQAAKTALDFAALVGAAVEPGSVTPPTSFAPALTEAETRRLYIDTYLEEAGWKVSDAKDVVDPGGASIEVKVTGMPPDGQDGFCDYVLFGNDGRPLAVVEAKKTSVSEEKGRVQVQRYGECLERQHGVKPVLYYTNGYTIKCLDRIYAEPRRLVVFHTLKELERMHALRSRGKIGNMNPNPEIAGRPYQSTAIKSICEHLDGKHRKGLLVLATGTGKTRVSIALIDVLTRNGWIENVLFLADRRELVRQAHKEFVKQLPNMTYSVLSDKKLKGSEDARIMFSTHQTMIRYIDAEAKKFTPGRFDLIVIDEAHRSIFNKYGAIFRYFDSLLVGLTATPKEDVDANTYKIFDCESGSPNFSYQIEEAVKAGWLVDWELYNRTTDVLQRGIHYSELSEEEREAADELFEGAGYDETPEHVSNSKIFKAVYNTKTVDLVLQDLMKHGFKVGGGETLGKAVVFAMNHHHAEMIVERFKKLYPQYPEEYCQLIDNYEKFADTLIDDFKTKPGFRIAVSVDMLDTGIDVPEILNLVFFKQVKSKIKFIQMVGRGTRTCEDVFGPGLHKKKFRAFDWCGNFEYFGMGGKGSEDGGLAKSLTQNLFELRLSLARQLQHVDHQQFPWRKAYRKELVAGLHAATVLLKSRTARIDVRENLPHIDKYVSEESWKAISPMAESEISTFIAPLVEGGEGSELVKMFDARMLRIENVVASVADVEKAKADVRAVMKTAKALQGLGSIDEIAAKAKELKELASDEIWLKPDIERIEMLRKALRMLMPYLKDEKKALVDLQIDDRVQERFGAGWMPDVRTYREKVIDYLLKHSDSPVIAKIRALEKLTHEDMDEIERVCFKELGTREDFEAENKDSEGRSLAGFLRSLTGLDQKAVNDRFGEFLNDNSLTVDQQSFVSEVIDYLRANGEVSVDDLKAKAPFNDMDLAEIFGGRYDVLLKIRDAIVELESIAV